MQTFKRFLPIVLRVIFGLIMFVFGLNGFFNFFPPPPPGSMPAGAEAFAKAMMDTGYLLQLLKAVEVVGGALLLANRFVPLALAMLAPVVVNIVAFHLFLAPPNPVTFLVLFAEIFLAWHYRHAFLPMLQMKTAAPSA